MSWTQYISGVLENSREPDRAGFRINLPVCEKKTALVWIRGDVGEDKFQFELGNACTGLRVDQVEFCKLEVLLLVQR